MRLRSVLDNFASSRSVAGVAAVATLASLSLAVPVSAVGANSFGQDMFGIATGGTIQNEDPTTMGRDLDALTRAGSQWVRVDINWAQIQAQGRDRYRWDETDRVVQSATDRGLKVVGLIVYSPGWARPPGTSASHRPDPQEYARFAGTAVERYAALGVHAYEVWNEPNIQRFWEPAPDPTAYAELLRAAYPAIKAADAQATVLTAGTAPAVSNGTNIAPVAFLEGIYAAGGGGSFDAVAHHPYCWPALPGERQDWSAWYQMYGTSPSLRSVMSDNGDADKKIWATEFGAPTGGPNSVSEDAQARMIMRAYSLWRTYDWGGPLFTYQGRDHGTSTGDSENFFGLLRNNWSEKPSFAAYRAVVDGASDVGDVAADATGSGAAADVADTADTSLSVLVRGRSRKGKGKVRGKVSAEGGSTRAGATTSGRVSLHLRRLVDGRWRDASSKRTAALEERGRFRERLDTFRLGRRRPGTYRVRARFVGPPGTTRSVDLSNRFRLG